MRRTILITAGALLALGAAAALSWRPASAQDAADAAAIAEARRSLVQLRGEAARARERAAMLDAQARSALQAGDRAILAAAALAARVQQAEAALASAEADLALVAKQRQALDTRLALERAPIARLLAGLQLRLRRPPLLELLQPGSIEDAVHLRAAIAAVTPQIRDRTASLRGALARARALESEAARVAAQRRDAQAELVTRRHELAAASAAERLKARRAAGSADREAERAFALGEKARDLSSLVAGLEADRQRLVGSGPESTAGGRTRADSSTQFRFPTAGRVASPEGSPPQALTLLPRPGALVVAPAAGRVTFAGPYRGYGTIVIMEHDGGWTSLLTGLASSQVAVGQVLVAGSPLGQAAVRDPQITLELRRNGKRVNPLDQLR